MKEKRAGLNESMNRTRKYGKVEMKKTFSI